MRSRTAALAALCLLAAAGRSPALDLHAGRSSPYDLALSGRLAGVPAGETRYARWGDLRALPTAEIAVDGEFVKGPEVLTVVFLGDLWKALAVEPGADAVLATCGDGYTSVFTSDFISRYRPFLVLAIDGKGPTDWPPPGLAFNPGPYVISVSAALVPGAARYRDLQHKKPWGVATLEFASYADRFRPFYSGKWASPGPAARTGREIWINSCASCHNGPAGVFGGTKAGRPFEVVAAYAGYDRAFFLKYLRDPKSLVASAKMPPQPDYTDVELSGLIAFLTAGPE
jgi:cytochrome c2